ncbi:MAG: hypothetical protein WKG07_43590 [Hymenobacter sp.]
MTRKDELAKKLFMSQGITFTVCSSGEGIEKIFPFDIIPRIISNAEWLRVRRRASSSGPRRLIYFTDIYHQQVIPRRMAKSRRRRCTRARSFCARCSTWTPHDAYTHIAGVDLIRRPRRRVLRARRSPCARLSGVVSGAGESEHYLPHFPRPAASQATCCR